jgi:MFS family permease
MGGAAGAVGVVLGGVLTAELSWRWVLFVNIPLGAGLLAAAVLSLLPAPARAEPARLDLPGALSVTLGIGALTYGLSQASADGWGSASVVAALAAAAVLMAGFVAAEATSSRPLIPLTLFRPRGLRVGNLLMLCMGASMTAVFFFVSLYLQQALGYSALRTGLALLPITVVLVAGGLASRQLVPVVGPRRLLVIGGLTAAAGTAWLALAPARPAYLTHILGPSLVAGAGISFMLLAVTLAGTAGVGPSDAGAAAGLLNTSRQLGGAVGLGVLSTVAATATARAARHATPVAALVHGYHVAFLGGAAVMLVAALAALALPGAARHSAPR